MAPLILPSDKVIVKKTKTFSINDIVVFKKGPRLIAHRAIYMSEGRLITKGDNNLKSESIAKNQILGKVEEVKRGKNKIKLSLVYLSQSSVYLIELKSLTVKFSQTKVNYILLKGLPLHLLYQGAPPKRLYLDVDILIKKDDFPKTAGVLEKQGFRPVKPYLFGKVSKHFSQISFVKKVEPFPVIVDIHFEPAVGFTKATSLNSLIPYLNRYTDHLFRNTFPQEVEGVSFPILKREEYLLYLLIHLFHHNFQGPHRMELVDAILRKKNINWHKFENSVNKFAFEDFIYPEILLLKKYYSSPFPSEITTKLYPSLTAKILGAIILKWVSPFNKDAKNIERAKRLFFLFLLAKQPFLKKILLLQNLQKIL